MYYQGYLKVQLVTPTITIGNPLLNVAEFIKVLNESNTAITLFPELSLTGYTAGDLFFQAEFLEQALNALNEIITKTTYQGIYIIGMPLSIRDCLFNVAVVIQDKTILGIIPKEFLPNYQEFNEKRWFTSGRGVLFNKVDLLGQSVPFGRLLFTDVTNQISFGVEICQDLWTINSPGDNLSLAGAHLILNLSASTEYITKPEQRRLVVADASRRQMGAYLYTSSGPGEANTDVVFSTHKLAAVNGEIIADHDIITNSKNLEVKLDVDAIKYHRRMSSTYRDQQEGINDFTIVQVKVNESQFDLELDQTPFIPKLNYEYQMNLAHQLQVQALIGKLTSLPKAKIIIGISGGLDSTLALIVADAAIKRLGRDPKDIIGVTMPAEATSTRSKQDALLLMKKLGVTCLEIPIETTLNSHLKDIKHEAKDLTYENAQARIRTLNLMDLANKYQGFVLGTGDLSEIALGWMTFNGDQMSMYAINSGLTKTYIKALISYHANHDYQLIRETLESILKAPISPELLSGQQTEDLIGKYEVNDFILYHHLVNGASQAKCVFLVQQSFKLTKKTATEVTDRFFNRFYSQQFKRQPMPEGPKILKISLSPRGDLRIPSDIKRK